MSVYVADKKSRTDGPAFQMLQQVNSPIPIVLMARTPSYRFNEELLNLDKYILIEFSEMGWDWTFEDTHVWGMNTDKFPQFESEEYRRFDDWVAANRPIGTFSREILRKDIGDTHQCIDYPCWFQVPSPVSRGDFNSRKVSFFHFFGRSHEGRLKAHADAWHNAGEYGYSLCDNIFHLQKFMFEEEGRKAVSLWQPHYARVDLSALLQINEMSKISLALAGAGRKTFRTVEVSSSAAMLMWKDEMKWAYDWVDGVNCIKCDEGKEIETVFKWINDDRLYDVYIGGVETCRKYEVNRYIKEYIEPIIKKWVE